ncbi:MAG: heme A synthase [Candidatus Planktophila sp.]|nr:heme A synthase [Candidatus Planktophila sp.]MBP7902904.1 heme A synthase [Candidatus Planktophila sp.]
MLATRALTPVARLLLALQALLVLTGGAVRVTGSGLGCPTWPECTSESYFPVEGQAEGAFHAWIEFGNRLLTFALLFAAIAMVAVVLRAGRRDLRLLALGQIAGIFGQGILGGITVLTKLNPISVASHFVLSIILIAAAQSLLTRTRATKLPHPAQSKFLAAHTLLTFIVIVAGTLVTGAGPHAGDSETPRLDIAVELVAGIHGYLVVVLILLTLAGIYKRFANFADNTQRLLAIFLAITLAQGVIGYAQYLLGVPEGLVILHLLGSSILWIAAWRVRLTQFYTFEKAE